MYPKTTSFFVLAALSLLSACNDGSSIMTAFPDSGLAGPRVEDSATPMNADGGSLGREDAGDDASLGELDSSVSDLGDSSRSPDMQLPPPGFQCGVEIRPEAPQLGVVYGASLSQNRLSWYRVDGDEPNYENSMTLQSGTIDMALDSDRDLLFVLHDTIRQAATYRLTRPTSADEPLFSIPIEVARSSFTHLPVAFTYDRIRQRLFTLTLPPAPGDGSPISEMFLEVIDFTDLNAPSTLNAFAIPPATAIALDAQRGLLFLYANVSKQLLVYDVTATTPRPLPEMNFDLDARFNEPSQTGFRLKGLRIDEERGILYAARDQVPNSQAVAFKYDAASSQIDGCIALAPMTVATDPLDQSIPASERTNLMGASVVAPVLGTENSFFVYAAWNGNAAEPMVTMLDKDLNFQETCAEFETYTDLDFNFGCFIGGSAFEDKGVCVDSFHRVGAVNGAVGVSFFPILDGLTLGQEVVINQGSASTLVCH